MMEAKKKYDKPAFRLVTDLGSILECLYEVYGTDGTMLIAGNKLSDTVIYPFIRMIKKKCKAVDAEKLNQGFVVFCSVKLRRLNRDIAAEFTRIIQDIPEVTECYNISGSYDYLLKIHAPNMKYYQEFILNVLGTIDSLGSLESTFVMAEVKHQYGIHI